MLRSVFARVSIGNRKNTVSFLDKGGTKRKEELAKFSTKEVSRSCFRKENFFFSVHKRKTISKEVDIADFVPYWKTILIEVLKLFGGRYFFAADFQNVTHLLPVGETPTANHLIDCSETMIKCCLMILIFASIVINQQKKNLCLPNPKVILIFFPITALKDLMTFKFLQKCIYGHGTFYNYLA